MRYDTRTIIDISQDAGLHRTPSMTVVTKRHVTVTIPKYHYTRDKPDKRDYVYKVSTKASPTVVDLRPWCSPIENQGLLGSCTGQAIAGALELLYKRGRKPVDLSRLFIYYYERVLINTVNYDSGAYIRDGIKVTNKQGAPLERFWPYDITKFKLKPSNNAINDALNRKVTLYQRVLDHNGCLDALANGFPVVIGFNVYSSFESPVVATTGMMRYPDKKREKLLGGHAVLLVGYNKQRNHYIVRNSWGSNWGDGGYFYMPFQVIQDTTMAGDAWIIQSVNMP